MADPTLPIVNAMLLCKAITKGPAWNLDGIFTGICPPKGLPTWMRGSHLYIDLSGVRRRSVLTAEFYKPSDPVNPVARWDKQVALTPPDDPQLRVRQSLPMDVPIAEFGNTTIRLLLDGAPLHDLVITVTAEPG